MSYNNPRTTDKYVKIKKVDEKAADNEIRIRAGPQIGRYISYAATLLLDRKLDTVIIKASGVAVKSACQIAEILRHKILGLHQLTQLKTITVSDEYEPKEEGLDRVVVERHLAVLEITLSLKDGVLDAKNVGYQAPLPKDQVQEAKLEDLVGRRPPRGDRPPREEGERREGGERREEGERREGGRGRGRGFRRGRYAGPRGGGRGRGGYGGRPYDREEGEGRRGGYGGRPYDREEGQGRRGGYGGRPYNREEGEGRRGGYGGRNYDREEGQGRRGGYGDRRGGNRPQGDRPQGERREKN